MTTKTAPTWSPAMAKDHAHWRGAYSDLMKLTHRRLPHPALNNFLEQRRRSHQTYEAPSTPIGI